MARKAKIAVVRRERRDILDGFFFGCKVSYGVLNRRSKRCLGFSN